MTRTRPNWLNVLLLAASAVVFVTFLSLGTWQLKRLAWKIDLIAQVESRAFAAPVDAPLGDTPAYLNVTVTGAYVQGSALRIKAVTDIGPGSWLMTPFRTDTQTLWVNRGFVPTGSTPTDWATPDAPVTITGLVRLPVPDGTWLEKNDPASNRWFSADLDAMSEHAGLTTNTAYYIDAVHTGAPAAFPRGSMTKLTFRNTHLSYAITWYAMAALLAAGIGYVIWDQSRKSSNED